MITVGGHICEWAMVKHPNDLIGHITEKIEFCPICRIKRYYVNGIPIPISGSTYNGTYNEGYEILRKLARSTFFFT